jgi:hypothetical protein
MDQPSLNRRSVMSLSCGVTLGAPSWLAAGPKDPQSVWKIGACDWSLGLARSRAALKLAAQIGLDGVQVSVGRPGAGCDL